MSGLYLDTLDDDRKRVFLKFDLFLHEPLNPNLLRFAHQVLGPGCNLTLNQESQINLRTPESVSVTFFYEVFPPLFPLVKTNVIDLMDLRDLASNKAATIGFRGKWRDYVDAYFLLKEKKTTLAEMISVSEKRRETEFSARLFLQQFVYFEDINNYRIEFVNDPVDPQEIKKYLENTVKEYLHCSVL